MAGPLDPANVPRWTVEPAEEAVERYLAKLALPIRVIALELDALARAELRGCVVGIKWGVPHYALRGPLCYISGSKRHVNFGFHQGIDIDDRPGLLEGTTKSPIRKSIFKAGEPLPRAIVRGWLRQARKLDASTPR